MREQESNERENNNYLIIPNLCLVIYQMLYLDSVSILGRCISNIFQDRSEMKNLSGRTKFIFKEWQDMRLNLSLLCQNPNP